MDGGIEFSTAKPSCEALRRPRRQPGVGGHRDRQTVRVRQAASRIFEFGFSDAILQMWAAFLAEREGALGDRLGCVTPREAFTAHEIFLPAQESGASCSVVAVGSR